MPKKDYDESIISDTGNWNVADQFSKSKIMRPLNLCDLYEDIATFGYESIIDDLINFETPPNDHIKIKGLQRLIRELIKLINNSMFALKYKGTKEKCLEYKKSLKKLQAHIPNLVDIVYDDGEQTVTIKNLALYESFLNIVCNIKANINDPLNQNHLIFTPKDEFDPKKFKNKIKDRMINQG